MSRFKKRRNEMETKAFVSVDVLELEEQFNKWIEEWSGHCKVITTQIIEDRVGKRWVLYVFYEVI